MTNSEPNAPSRHSCRLFRTTVRAMMLLPVVVALATWLYVLKVRWSIGPVPIGIKTIIPLHLVILDNDTGLPIQDAKVEMPFFHPDWRNRPDLRDCDLRKGYSSPGEITLPFVTDRFGRAETGMVAGFEVRLKHRFSGLIPVAGSPEVVISPILGVRVSAEGYETWARFLDEIAREDGRKLAHGSPLSVVVRLKRVSLEPTSQ